MTEQQKRNLELHQAYKRLFETDDGHKVLEDIKERARHKGTTFDPNPTVAAYNEGWRSLLCYILDRMKGDKRKGTGA